MLLTLSRVTPRMASFASVLFMRSSTELLSSPSLAATSDLLTAFACITQAIFSQGTSQMLPVGYFQTGICLALNLAHSLTCRPMNQCTSWPTSMGLAHGWMPCRQVVLQKEAAWISPCEWDHTSSYRNRIPILQNYTPQLLWSHRRQGLQARTLCRLASLHTKKARAPAMRISPTTPPTTPPTMAPTSVPWPAAGAAELAGRAAVPAGPDAGDGAPVVVTFSMVADSPV